MEQEQATPVVSELKTGIWHSTYRYPSSGRRGMFEGEHFVRLARDGEWYVLESLPHASKSQLVVRLVVDGRIATGTWREKTSLDGYYKGAVYHGAIQLVIDEEWQAMRGKWVGFSKDLTVNVGAWDFTFVGEDLPAELRPTV